MQFSDLVLLFTSVFCHLPSLGFPYSSLVIILLLFSTLFFCCCFTMHFSFFQKVFLSHSTPLTLYKLIRKIVFILIPLKIPLKLVIFSWLCKEMEFSLQCFFLILGYEFLSTSIGHIVVELWSSDYFPGTP